MNRKGEKGFDGSVLILWNRAVLKRTSRPRHASVTEEYQEPDAINECHLQFTSDSGQTGFQGLNACLVVRVDEPAALCDSARPLATSPWELLHFLRQT